LEAEDSMPQPTLEPLRRWDPERMGPYALLGRLGAGAMGQVYLGRSTAGRLVAVKTIKIELAEEPGFRDHFAHEVAAARRVSGLFTAAVVAADPEADVPWLATAYLPAPSLSRLVKACGPQPAETIFWLAAGCAEALESIHGAGLVHRDLKPSNVLVAPDGPRVIDFGVARAAERIQLTVTRGAVGTPAYMAPEQARDTRQASMASDVFALGATLLFAATGHPPYQGETVMDVLVRLATEPPDLSGLPAELAELVTACLQRSPRDRPTSAAVLRRLGPLLASRTDADGKHSYLTEPAMALIGEYERSPQLEGRPVAAGYAGDLTQASQPGSEPSEPSEPSDPSDQSDLSDPSQLSAAGEDGVTYASSAALAVLDPPRPKRGWPRRRAKPPADPPAASNGHPPNGLARTDDSWPGSPRRREATLSLAGLAVAAVVLVGAGAGVGALLRNPATRAPGHHAGLTGALHKDPASTIRLPIFPPVFSKTSKPTLAMFQPSGDGYTTFVVHGTGWVPGSWVTVSLQTPTGLRATGPPGRAGSFADHLGTFNYTVNQDRAYFPGLLKPGEYRVVVRGPGGRHAVTTFRVIVPPAAPPPGGSPPPGAPPPGGGPPPS
jgi:serine/threonine protein kinase